MITDKDNFSWINRPVYVLEEEKLRRNLALLADVSQRASVDVILAFKAYALWRTFPIFKEYINATTASSLYEARLAFEEFGVPAHTYSPAYTDYEIEDIELSFEEQTVRCPSCNKSVPHKNHHNSIRYEPNIVPLPYTPYNSPAIIPYKIDITCESKNS